MGSRGIFLAIVALAGFLMLAGSAAALRAEDAPDTLPRVVSTLDGEPLILIACRGTRSLSDKFAATTLSKMLNDPLYDRGLALIQRQVVEWFGGDLRAVWPDLEKLLSGPVALALIPEKTSDGRLNLRAVFLVQINEPELDADVRRLWPAVAPMANSFARNLGQLLTQQMAGGNTQFTVNDVELKTVATAQLPPSAKLQAWAARAAWPKGDFIVRVKPLQLCGLVKLPAKDPAALPAATPTVLESVAGSGIESFVWSVGFNGEAFSERLALDVAESDAPFKKLAGAVRENPPAWEGLMTATPGDVDVALMFQNDLGALGADLPYIFQAFERELRGKRWTKALGTQPAALAPSRFKFLSDRMLGAFSLTAKPAITGEMRLTLTTAIKGGDVEAFRAELIRGLQATGAVFETLIGARKIGGALPLGAAFRGRGQFATPVIGLSPGWAWLCSSSVAYQELTDAFKNSKTVAAREKRRAIAANPLPDPKNAAAQNPAPSLAAAGTVNEWSADDSIRAEVNLDRVLKIGYAAWLLSSTEGPSIGGVKIPDDLVPAPQVLSQPLGKWRGSVVREENRLEFRSTCVFPGLTLASFSLFQDGSDAIVEGRKLAAELAKRPAPEPEPVAPENEDGDTPAKTKPGKKDKNAAPPDPKAK